MANKRINPNKMPGFTYLIYLLISRIRLQHCRRNLSTERHEAIWIGLSELQYDRYGMTS